VFSDIDESSEVMLISQYGKIIRMDSSTIRDSGRSAQGVSACCTWKREIAWQRQW
jgi:DNA gyrase/topoisomerase IV subunit A